MEQPGSRRCPQCGAPSEGGAVVCGACSAPLSPMAGAAMPNAVRIPEVRAPAPSAMPLPAVPAEAPQIDTDAFIARGAAEPPPVAGALPQRATLVRVRGEHRAQRSPVPVPLQRVADPPPMPAPAEVEVVSSIDYGRRPEPGAQAEPYHWTDVLQGSPPPRRSGGEGSYAVYHAIELDADVRLTFQTVVSTRRHGHGGGKADLAVVVDARTSVQKRALLEVMDRVRASADHHARRKREALARRLAQRRSNVLRWPRWSRRLGFALTKVDAHVGTSLINLRRSILRGTVEVPDALLIHLLRAESHLGTRLGRQSLWDGIKDPSGLTGEQRSVVLFLTTVLVAAGVLFLNSFFALALPEHANVYRQLLGHAALQFIGLLGAPIIIEPLIILAVIGLGPILGLLGFFVGKMLAAWVLYLLGDHLHHHLAKMKDGFMKRGVDWVTEHSQKYGFVVLVLANALPLAPDQIILVLAVSGMAFRSWTVAIFLGTAIRFAALAGGVVFWGPEKIEAFFHNPLSAL